MNSTDITATAIGADAMQQSLSGDQALFMFVSLGVAFLLIGAFFIGIYKGVIKVILQRKRKRLLRKFESINGVEILSSDAQGTPTLIKYKIKKEKGVFDTYEFI